jgi:hypothetical protein
MKAKASRQRYAPLQGLKFETFPIETQRPFAFLVELDPCADEGQRFDRSIVGGLLSARLDLHDHPAEGAVVGDFDDGWDEVAVDREARAVKIVGEVCALFVARRVIDRATIGHDEIADGAGEQRIDVVVTVRLHPGLVQSEQCVRVARAIGMRQRGAGQSDCAEEGGDERRRSHEVLFPLIVRPDAAATECGAIIARCGRSTASSD